jgi:hypothetical protein
LLLQFSGAVDVQLLKGESKALGHSSDYFFHLVAKTTILSRIED